MNPTPYSLLPTPYSLLTDYARLYSSQPETADAALI
jgi:hypothetical protein